MAKGKAQGSQPAPRASARAASSALPVIAAAAVGGAALVAANVFGTFRVGHPRDTPGADGFSHFRAPGGGALSRLTREHNDTLLWGTWRPGVLFGVKSRTFPESAVVGLMWTSVSAKEGSQRVDGEKLRHTCEESETKEGLLFGFSEHDGSSYGYQAVTDPGHKLTLRTYFYKQDPRSWSLRVAGNASKGKKALYFYVGVDQEFADGVAGSVAIDSLAASAEGSDPAVIVAGTTRSLGDFRLAIVPAAGSLVPVAGHGVIPLALPRDTPIVRVKEALLRSLRGGDGDGADDKKPALLQAPAAAPGTPENWLILQLVVQGSFEVDVVFRGAGSSVSSPSGAKLTESLRRASEEFRSRFQKTFQLEHAGVPDEKIAFARSAMSALLGGLGYFYGSSKVKVGPERIIDAPKRPLFTAVPSRSFFPRGFLWDEGFHQLLVGRWDPAIARDAIAHWFATMREDGWVPREQILGSEAVAKVPDWALPQHPTHANPPTLLLAIEALVEGAGASGRGATREWLSAIFPAVERWFEWFRTSQAGAKKGSFRWHGRDPKDGKLNAMTLSSGLDDYPRASAVSDDERHVDLHSWVAFGAGILANVAELAGEPANKAEKYRTMREELVTSLEEFHWDVERKQYSDYGLHSNDGKYVPHIVVKCSKPDGSNAVEHAVSQDVYRQMGRGGDKKAACPPEFPKFMFPLGDGQGGLLMRERFVPKKERLQFVAHTGYVSLFPMLLRLLPPDSPRLMDLFDLLGDPKRGLWSNFGLRSLAEGDKMYLRDNAPGDAPYWRGPIWINCNFLAVSALRHYASLPGPHQQRAADLQRSLSDNLVNNLFKTFERTGYLWEQYNPRDGSGQRTHPFNGWSSLVVLMMG